MANKLLCLLLIGIAFASCSTERKMHLTPEQSFAIAQAEPNSSKPEPLKKRVKGPSEVREKKVAVLGVTLVSRGNASPGLEKEKNRVRLKDIKRNTIYVVKALKEKTQPPAFAEVSKSIKKAREMDMYTCGCIGIILAALFGWVLWWSLTKMGMKADKLAIILGCVAFACIVAALAGADLAAGGS